MFPYNENNRLTPAALAQAMINYSTPSCAVKHDKQRPAPRRPSWPSPGSIHSGSSLPRVCSLISTSTSAIPAHAVSITSLCCVGSSNFLLQRKRLDGNVLVVYSHPSMRQACYTYAPMAVSLLCEQPRQDPASPNLFVNFAERAKTNME